ncbi:MAG: amino acid ABC transporter permease [Candidatus Puniceispirillaceae bacterium]
MADHKNFTNQKSQHAFVREKDAPLLPPPATEAGVTGWLWQNIFASMADFSSVASTFRSGFVAALTMFLLYFGFTQIYALLDFGVFSAVWSDPDELKREVCWTVDQGGNLPSGWHGACWPFIYAKHKFILYGAYPMEELWRVNLSVFAGIAGLVYVLIDGMPRRREVGAVMLTLYPLLCFILLSGGNSNTPLSEIGLWLVIGLAVISVGRMAKRGFLGSTLNEFNALIGITGWAFVIYNAIRGVGAIDFGLEPIDTRDWGGLLITLVVAVTGIVASLPLGVILALGRRSEMPVARLICTIFIEFWRGVPLITVLFMASVMLPLFLPEGVNFDNLLRALIGVMLFSAAYMAEVIRGGLQAIDKGQYEGAQAMGLSYWQSMRLIILPQALTHVIPGIVNTFIGLFKDTTLVSIVGIFDLLGAGQSAIADAAWSTPVQATTMYLYIAIIFFVFCFGMSRYSIHMENKLSKSRRH